MRAHVGLFCGIVALVGCSSSAPGGTPTDGGADGDDGAIAPEHEPACGADPTGLPSTPTPSTRVATITPTKTPLAEPTPMSPIDHATLTTALAAGLGDTVQGLGEDGGVVDDLLPGATASAGVAGRKSLLWFAQLSDFQLVDDESPARLMTLDNPAITGAARPQEGGVAHAVSAMHRTLAAITKARPFDFEIVTGDCADSAQQNELGWFVDLMDGKPGLSTDSGDDDDPVVGPGNDVKDPFDPIAAPAPWYFVFGNHDVEVQGTSMPDEASAQRATGTDPLNGTRDYRLMFAPVTREAVPADPRRKQLARQEILDLVTSSNAAKPGPAGHGFAPGATTTSYTVTPIAGLPLRLIELDTSSPWGGSDGLVKKAFASGVLEPALAKADADHVMVILASHHSTTALTTRRGLDSALDADAIEPAALEALVASHPSVVLWLVGHDHQNRIRPIRGPSAAAPGYYEIMTDAIADWPSQARAIELVVVPSASGGPATLSIFTSMIDYEARTCLEARFRAWSLVDVNDGYSPTGAGLSTDRNVELRRALPAGVVTTGLGASVLQTETTMVGK